VREWVSASACSWDGAIDFCKLLPAAFKMLDCPEALMETSTCPAHCLQDGALCENPKCEISMSWEELFKLDPVGKVCSPSFTYSPASFTILAGLFHLSAGLFYPIVGLLVL